MMSCTMRFTRGSVRFASARVKNLCATLVHHDPLHLFGVRYESYDLLVTVQNDNGGAHMMIVGIDLLCDLEALQLGFGLYDGRIGARMISSRAIGWIVPRADAAGDDVAVGDRSEIVAIFRIIHDRHDRNVLDSHESGHFGRRRAGGSDDRISNHHFRCSHPVILRPSWWLGNPSRHTPAHGRRQRSLLAPRRRAHR